MTTADNRPYSPIFNIVLHRPEIPQNTGNIGRLCVATRSHLHLSGTLGFSLDEKSRRRAGLDYWNRLVYTVHPEFDEIEQSAEREQMFFFSKSSERSLYDIEFKEGDFLVFGSETTGFPHEMREEYSDRTYGIPMIGDVRSLNLANSVAIVAFTALRNIGKV